MAMIIITPVHIICSLFIFGIKNVVIKKKIAKKEIAIFTLANLSLKIARL